MDLNRSIAECPSGALDGVSNRSTLLEDEVSLGSEVLSEIYKPDTWDGPLVANPGLGRDDLNEKEAEIPMGWNPAFCILPFFEVSCPFDSEHFSKASNWSFVRASCFFPLVLQCLVLFCVLAVAASSAICADELLTACRALLQRERSIRRLYFWPPLDSGMLCKTFLRICCFGSLCLLELAEDDLAYQQAIGGVQILQGYFYVMASVYASLEICSFLRLREEQRPRFPSQCRFRAGSRADQRRRKTWTNRKLLAVLLLCNLASAEAVGVLSDARRANFDIMADESSADASNWSQPVPEVDDVCPSSSSSAFSGLQEDDMSCPFLTQGDLDFERTLRPQGHTCDNSIVSCASSGYHTSLSAVHDFCPHFVTGLDNPASCQPSGDFLSNRINPNVLRAFPIALLPLPNDEGRHWTANVWFAGYPSCREDARQKQYYGDDFAMFREDFNLLWQDECGNNCDFIMIRPQPPSSDFLLGSPVKHFVIWRRQLFSLRAVLIRSQCTDGIVSMATTSYQACGVTMSNREHLCHMFRRSFDESPADQGIRSHQMFPIRHGEFFYAKDARCRDFETLEFDNDLSVLMQVGPPAEDVLGRYIRLSVANHRNTRILVWFHPLDARGRISRRFKFEAYNHELPAGPQVRSFWAGIIGRRQCFVYPVHPVPPSIGERHPQFILTTFQVNTIYPVLLDYVPDTEDFRATFLFYFLGYPDVHGIFVQAIPMNQCVWLTECTVHMVTANGVQIYEWGQIVPLFRGAFITLHESDPHDDASDSTCSSNHDGACSSTDSEDSFRTGHPAGQEVLMTDETTILMQRSLTLRENTATLERPTTDDVWTLRNGVIASYAILHYEDALAEYVYKATGRSWMLHRSVQSWVVTYVYQLGYVPRFCTPAQDLSLTRCLLDTWYDITNGEEIGFAQELSGAIKLRDDMVFNVLGAPLSKLRLGYRVYLITGWPDPIPSTIALLCSGTETVYDLILRFGYSERCRNRRCFLFQDRGGLNPVWAIGDIVNEDRGSSFSLLYEEQDACHQTDPIGPRTSSRWSSEAQGGDEFIGMQLLWTDAFAAEDLDLHARLGLRPNALAEHVLWPHNGQVLIDPTAGREDDPLSIYLMTLRPMHHFPVHSITTWMGTGEIVLTARNCAYVKDRPFTRAFLLEWEDFHEEGPFLTALVHPEMPPLSLRVSSLHLVSLTRRQQAAQDRIFLIDILFQGLPRRTAVRVSVGDTVREVVRRLDLLHLCGPMRYRCVLTQYEGSKEWNLFDIIEEPHATSFKLLFRNHGREALCQRSVPEAQPDDMTSLMQGAANSPTPLTLYLRGWSHAKGAATFWVHCRADVMVQQYSAICSFDWPSLADEQCESLWQHCRPWQELNVVPVDPPPVFLVLPRPHVLIIGSPIGGDLPILCQVHERGRHNLVSVLVPYRSPDIAVATLFHLVIPQHDCEFGSQCYVVHDDERFLYRHELRLHKGAFLKLYEVARAESDYDTTCSGDLEDNQLSDALSVTSDPDSGLGTASELSPISDSLVFEDFASLMQRHSADLTENSDPPTTLSTRRTDSEDFCDGSHVRGPIEQAPHYQSQMQQIETLRMWLLDLIGSDPQVTLFVFEGLGADVATHQVVFPRAVLQEVGGFPTWLQRELRSLWRGQARIFPLQSAPYVDLRIAVLLQAAFGHELPVLLEIHEQQGTWREIHVVTQAVTVNSLIWRSRLPPIVPETQHYQVAFLGNKPTQAT